jgi:hypothetical protein
MEASVSTPAEALRFGTIREFLHAPGPCITIVLPSYHPGAATGSPATILKTYVQDATRQLADCKVPIAQQSAMIQPLARLAEDPVLATGSQTGRVIFRSPSIFHQLTSFCRRNPPSMWAAVLLSAG